MKKKFIITDSSPPKQEHKSPPKQAHKSPKHAHKSPPKQAHKSPPKQAHKSPPKQAHKSPPKNVRLTNTKFIIEDTLSPRKHTRLTNTKFIIEDIISPATTSNQCCSCRRDRNMRINTDCVWCQFQNHLDKCVDQKVPSNIVRKQHKRK
jgi:hypothetical protein